MSPENKEKKVPRKKGKGTRRIARELALQILYQWEILNQDLESIIENFFTYRRFKKSIKDFTRSLVLGMHKNLEFIDKTISSHINNWHLDRLSITDRNILRCAAYQILFRKDIPPIVAINEAVDIAKKYGDAKSGNFVNGILDAILREKEKG